MEVSQNKAVGGYTHDCVFRLEKFLRAKKIIERLHSVEKIPILKLPLF